ncbi:MAG: hypothetical protein J7L47_08740 [Candidatus Odinarchaeota archaeon]|nr:hypothetical protein [Candidatus Odinarchaeota archaeon]
MIHAVIIINSAGTPVLQLSNKKSNKNMKYVEMSGILEAVNLAVQSLIDSREHVQKIGLQNLVLLMKITNNDFRVVLVTDEESSAISAKLDKICTIVEEKGVSDEITNDIDEILSAEDVFESMKEWGKRLWG